MSTRVTRAEARRRMAALQEPRPGQGWSETRPTRAPLRALKRTRDEDSAPEPAVSSDSDVEVVGDPAVEEGESHSEDVCRATEETRKRFREREPSDEEQQRSTEEEARWQARLRQDHEAAATRWHARLREAEEEKRRLWEAPPSPRSEDEDEPCAPSPPRWWPEVPPTPRYEGEWLTDGARDGEGGAPLATPPWRPVRPPTPRYIEPQRPEEHTPSEEATTQPMPQPQEEEVHQARAEEPSVVRTEVPAAHVSHSTRAFVAEGVRWRQQTLVWTWPEGPATGPTKEEPRIWEEGVPKVNPRDPRTRSRQDAWVPPTPSTGPPTPATTATTGEAESLEKGPWVWPEPPATQRPPLQQQTSTPGSTGPRPQFMRQVSAPEEGGWREVARSEWPEGIEEAPAVATARRKGGRRCVLVNEGGRRYRVRLGVAGIRVFTQ
ncbi:nascent polypeptide-associated complex subunit alpha, muscle-specific form-like [Drosophila subpulchrella]|uniref:nascent polypeptide-associated complex subunit alpha, muscle-specific form-like n=1 Tax=Drosophila subpulchrella TaxID=1486046 RepID=UPI0018A17539|nr:nascent polypeptide-associated complex subunit alpha, muscle-specific form-like [Drosophila subpulchrella]